MADVMLKNAYGENKTYEGIQTVTLPTSDGGTATFSLGGSGNADWAQHDASQNDYIKNKPFWEGQRIYIDASNTTFDTTFSAMDTTWTKITDGAFSKDELIGCVMTVYLPEDNSSSVTITEQDITVEYDGGLLLNVLNVSVWICYRAGTHAFNNGDSAVTATILEAGAYLPSDFVSQVVAMEFVGSTKLLDNKHLAILSKEDDGEYKIKEEYIPDVPHFNLVEMGLVEPNLGETSSIEIDTTDIIRALKQGPVCFTVPFHNNFVGCETTTFITSGSEEGTLWTCNHRTSIWTKYRLLSLVIDGSGIMYGIGKLEPLPDVTEEDDGKTLIADQYGMWRVKDIPKELPAVTADDDGKVLAVKDGAWTSAEVSASGGTGGVSSWNDLTDKPFGEVDVIPEQEVAFELLGANNTIRASSVQGSTEWFADGKTYKIIWDGVEYSGTVKCVTEFTDKYLHDGIYYIGNPAVYDTFRVGIGEDAAGWVDTGEPFFMEQSVPNTVCAVWTTDTTNTSHTIRIIEEKKIDKKWLPGGGASSWNDLSDRPFYLGDGVVTEVLPSTTLPFDFSEGDGFYMFSTQPTSEQMALWNSDWAKAIITWGDVEYECEPKFLMGMKGIGNTDMLMGTGDTGEPFVMLLVTKEMSGEDMIMISDFESTPTADGAPTVMRNIAISTVSYDIHTLDPKFLRDVPWNKVSDAPFGELSEGTVVGEWTGVYEDADFGIFLSAPETPDLHPDVKMIIEGAIYSVEINGVTYEGIGVSSEMLKQNITSNMIAQSTDVGIAIYKDGSLWGAMATIQNLLWGIVPISTEGYIHNELYPVKITVVEAVKKLDAKYLAPFEYTNGLVEFLPESKITTVMNDDYGVYFNGLPVTQDMYERWQANTDTVQVTFDGIVYNCTPQLVGGYYGVGNGVPFGGVGNNEPFVVAVVTEDGYYYLVMFALTDTTNTNHKLSVSIMGRTSTLCKEALPKDAIKAYIDEYIGDILGGDY